MGDAGSYSSFRYNPTGGGWFFEGSAGISGNASGFTSGNPQAPQGAQAAFLQGQGSISQGVNGFQAGVTYTLSFKAAQRANHQSNYQQIEVFLGNQSLGKFTPPSDSYRSASVTFNAPASGSTSLRFVGLNPNGGDNTAFLDDIQLVGPSAEPAPSPLATGTGLKATYFANQDLSGSASLIRLDPQVDFDWGDGSPDASVLATNQFSVRWEGTLEAPTGGVYTFMTRSDDGVRLWINGVLIVNNWSDHGPTNDVGTQTVTLTAGQRAAVKMEFYENGGGAEARLYWSYPGQALQSIPRIRLYPAP
ncbi:MAG: DUF642 domain-containing protein [Cytophagales bacterium]|nr:DUF642 domain-containing protein [Armatimonadota bacterium]